MGASIDRKCKDKSRYHFFLGILGNSGLFSRAVSPEEGTGQTERGQTSFGLLFEFQFIKLEMVIKTMKN